MPLHVPHVVIVLFDNCDPIVYGPYDSEGEARRAIPSVERDVVNRGVADHHIDQIVVRKLIGGAP